ncbi:ribonucleoside-diphosphate reductase alpha chain [Enterococcus sp. DIV2402]|uniref:Ribonucleoside-diphosphate reductase alpha chain n=1 Tax=Candidatus Enterococcus lowellii TaxID=2230877 RepID=A0ABZ2SQN2_9ENTE
MKEAKNKELFAAIHLPTKADWQALKEAVAKDGLYHRNRLAIAPNGSISYINETSASLHPITQLVEQRQESNVGSIFYPAPLLSDQTLPFYTSAYDLDQRRIIDTYAVAQKHIDQGMSLTLFMRSVLPEGLYEWKNQGTSLMTTRDLNRLRNYAWTKGIKSLYYVRTFTEDDEIHTANECTACMI